MSKGGKPGPKSVDPASKGSNFANTSAGGPGRSFPQKPIAGPSGKGLPTAMKKALSKKGGGGRGSSFPGLVK